MNLLKHWEFGDFTLLLYPDCNYELRFDNGDFDEVIVLGTKEQTAEVARFILEKLEG